jgi:hypothetical protein
MLLECSPGMDEVLVRTFRVRIVGWEPLFGRGALGRLSGAAKGFRGTRYAPRLLGTCE